MTTLTNPLGFLNTWWQWPALDYYNFDATITPNADGSPDGYFFAHQFSLGDGSQVAGYAGLQTNSAGPGPTGKIAIFSLWGAIDARGPNYNATFSEGGTGWTCRVAYSWIVGHSYRVRVWYTGNQGVEDWWTVWILDQTTGVEIWLGSIKVPPGSGWLTPISDTFHERFSGATGSGSDLHLSSVTFGPLQANAVTGGGVAPVSHQNIEADVPSVRSLYGYRETDTGVLSIIGGTLAPLPTPPPTPDPVPVPETQPGPTITKAKTFSEGVRVYLRDASRQRVGEIDDFQSLTVTTKHTGTGSWSMTIPTSTSLSQYIVPGAGVIIERDGETYLSGPLAEIERQKNETKDTLTISGHDDTVWLARRMALPCVPNYPAAPHTYGASDYDTQTAPAETVIKHYVAYALGAYAVGNVRDLEGLVIAPDLGRGTKVTEQARFDNLAELLASTALAGGDLGFSIRQYVPGYDNSALVFDVTDPRDLTGIAKFSTGFGNLASYTYKQSAPDANYVIVAGGGEGVDRVTVEGGAEDSIILWGRIEGPLRDRRDTTDTAVMSQTLQEELAKSADKLSISVTVSDTERLKYGRDWGLSDRVSVIIDGVTYSDIVREVTVTWSTDKPEQVNAVIGTPDATAPDVLRLFAAQRNIAARTAQLERRK